MRSWLFGSAVAAGLCLVSPHAAFACDDSRVKYRDGFESMDLLWGLPNNLKKVEDGTFVFTLEPRTLDFTVNQFERLGDVDVCVTTTWKSGSEAEQTWSGLVFWATDDQNLYAFGVSPQGTVSVWRLVDNSWVNPLRWTAHDAVKTGPGAVNKIRVKTRGDKATFVLNDVEIGSMRGIAPEGHFVGLIAEALEKSDAVTHAFDDFAVALPGDEADAAPVADQADEDDAPEAAAAPDAAPPAPEPAGDAPAAPAPAPAADTPAPSAPEPEEVAAPAEEAKTEAEPQQPAGNAQPAAEPAKPAEAPAAGEPAPAAPPADAAKP
jgi:hypothetical protein